MEDKIEITTRADIATHLADWLDYAFEEGYSFEGLCVARVDRSFRQGLLGRRFRKIRHGFCTAKGATDSRGAKENA